MLYLETQEDGVDHGGEVDVCKGSLGEARVGPLQHLLAQHRVIGPQRRSEVSNHRLDPARVTIRCTQRTFHCSRPYDCHLCRMGCISTSHTVDDGQRSGADVGFLVGECRLREATTGRG
jgi:hypothetical protein